MQKRAKKIARWQSIKSHAELKLCFHKSHQRSLHHLLYAKSSLKAPKISKTEKKQKQVKYIKPESIKPEEVLQHKISSKDTISAAVESVLFCSSDAVTIDEIAGILLLPTSVIWNAVDELENRYNERDRGVMIIKKDDYISIVEGGTGLSPPP